MPIVKVEMLSGRTLTQKRGLVDSLTEVMVNTLGVSRDSVQVHLEEKGPDNVAIGGVLVVDSASPRS